MHAKKVHWYVTIKALDRAAVKEIIECLKHFGISYSVNFVDIHDENARITVELSVKAGIDEMAKLGTFAELMVNKNVRGQDRRVFLELRVLKHGPALDISL